MNFPSQNYKKPLAQMAKKYGISRQSARKIASEVIDVKSRGQYEADAKIRREMAFNLRQTGLKWKEVGEKLGVSEANAMMLARRYKG